MTASELYASMSANGAIRAPFFGGMARVAEPMFRGGQLRVVDAKLGRSIRVKFEDVKRGFEKAVEDDALEESAPLEDQAT